MGNKLPESISEMVSAISVGSDLGVMLLNCLKLFDGSPQDLLMITSEENWEFREELATAIYVGRFKHLINERGYHFLMPRRTTTVGEMREWLKGSPFQPRLGSGDMVCGPSSMNDRRHQPTVFLGSKPYFVLYGTDWNTGEEEVLSGGSHEEWQEDSKISPHHCIPVDYKVTPNAFSRVLCAWPNWQNRESEFLLEHTNPVSISVYLGWLEDHGLRSSSQRDIMRLPDWLEHWLGQIYPLAFSRRNVVCLEKEAEEYPIISLRDGKVIDFFPKTTPIPAGLLTLVRTKSRI
jgi:hypothetical protein